MIPKINQLTVSSWEIPTGFCCSPAVFLRTTFNILWKMSVYENVVAGKLKLKGKALDVKPGGIKKKKKKIVRDLSDQIITQTIEDEISEVGAMIEEDRKDENKSKGGGSYIDHLTPAERRYMEQRQKIDMQKMAKTSNKSHRDRISEFNQYLANMSEHYDIPKVGPG
ncbi:hypothetical protein L6452_17100 [Arctium lappa]|uniref:Uncharacterized protein n=1 Tax=Arctium lappa TaxID=4217 RepID=A0ACB9C2P4_ARCLA|nr:hypothetical protein L6452_17100 [Arctium lappa]